MHIKCKMPNTNAQYIKFVKMLHLHMKELKELHYMFSVIIPDQQDQCWFFKKVMAFIFSTFIDI